MTTHEDPNRPRRGDGEDPSVPAVESERGGITDASLDPDSDTDVETPDPSLGDDAAEVEAHPS